MPICAAGSGHWSKSVVGKSDRGELVRGLMWGCRVSGMRLKEICNQNCWFLANTDQRVGCPRVLTPPALAAAGLAKPGVARASAAGCNEGDPFWSPGCNERTADSLAARPYSISACCLLGYLISLRTTAGHCLAFVGHHAEPVPEARLPYMCNQFQQD